MVIIFYTRISCKKITREIKVHTHTHIELHLFYFFKRAKSKTCLCSIEMCSNKEYLVKERLHKMVCSSFIRESSSSLDDVRIHLQRKKLVVVLDTNIPLAGFILDTLDLALSLSLSC